MLNRTEILPIAVPLTWVGLNTTARNLSDALRPTIDEAYDNPEQGHGIGTSDVGLSLIHISEPTRRLRGSRMPSSA